MGFLDYFKRPQKSAAIAKDRLQIVIARERSVTRDAPDYLPQLQQELLQVIAKYELIDIGQVTVNVDRSDGCEVLELNVVLSQKDEKDAKPADDLKKPPVAVAAS
jgi:cell division topological specificity factor